MENHFSIYVPELTNKKPEQPYFPSSLFHAPGESVRSMWIVNVYIAKRKMVIIFQLSCEFPFG